jgi:hypothetical protein
MSLHGRNTNNEREVNALHIKIKQSTEIPNNRASIPDRDTG